MKLLAGSTFFKPFFSGVPFFHMTCKSIRKAGRRSDLVCVIAVHFKALFRS